MGETLSQYIKYNETFENTEYTEGKLRGVKSLAIIYYMSIAVLNTYPLDGRQVFHKPHTFWKAVSILLLQKFEDLRDYVFSSLILPFSK